MLLELTASCGAKAASAARLLTLAGKSNGLFQAPPGLALTFGIMQDCLEQNPVSEKRYLEYQGYLQDAEREEGGAILKTLRDIVSGLAIPTRICEEIRRFFGADTRLAVRSSANGEDLENLALLMILPRERSSPAASVRRRGATGSLPRPDSFRFRVLAERTVFAARGASAPGFCSAGAFAGTSGIASAG